MLYFIFSVLLHLLRQISKCVLTGQNHDVDGYPVELVLGPVVAGAKADAGQECCHGVCQEGHYAECCCDFYVSCKSGHREALNSFSLFVSMEDFE